MKLFCATSNHGKLREFLACGLDVEPLPGLGSLAIPEETGSSFEANAVLKAEYYSRFCDRPLFADDSGLEVDALDNAPGIYSARYAGEGATDEQNNELLLKNLAAVSDRNARFVCVIALARNGRLLQTFRGEAAGIILRERAGTGGFGYDPLFYFPALGKTFAELTPPEKFAQSHRGHALRRMSAWLCANSVPA